MARDDPPVEESAGGHAPVDVDWDERYAGTDRVWSGRPNGALVAEVTDLRAGTALDVGCGEGADAIWLAGRGWDVTALDVSEVALQRAADAAGQAGVRVGWMHAALEDAVLPPAGFDLVSAQYPALRRTAGRHAERVLADAVAPGGVLLVVHHADISPEHALAAGFDPADWVGPGDVTAVLDDGWRVEMDQRRPREIAGGAGAHHHHHDIVLVARRR